MLWRALCPVKAPVGGSDPRGLSLRGKNPIARNEADCHCELAKQSLFSACQTWTTEIATFLAMTRYNRDCRAALAMTAEEPCEAISLFCLPALDNRDRQAERPPFCHCEPAKQSLFSACQPWTTEIAAFLAMTRYNRNCRAALAMTAEEPCEAISFFCLPALNTRDRQALLYCHCEPAKQSLFSACQPWTTEIATFLAMTRYNRDCRAALAMTAEEPCEAISLFCLPALNTRDRHVPRDDRM